MRIENLVKRFNETTIKDDVYGAMSNIEDIKEAFGLDINIQEETQYFLLLGAQSLFLYFCLKLKINKKGNAQKCAMHISR